MENKLRKLGLGLACSLAFALPFQANASETAWNALSPEQQALLHPVAHEWDTLSSAKQDQLSSMAERYSAADPEAQTRFIDRLQSWSNMTPESRVEPRRYRAVPRESLETDAAGTEEASTLRSFSGLSILSNGPVVSNPGNFTWNLIGGDLAIGDLGFELADSCDPETDPACDPDPIIGSLDVAIDANGNFSVPQNAELFPPVEFEFDGDAVLVTFELTTPITGALNPSSGDANLDVNLSIRIQGSVSGVSLGNNCRIGTAGSPIALRFTTGESVIGDNEPLVGSPYDGDTSRLRLVDARYAVPGASGCGGFLSFIVTPILNGELGLPSAAGNNLAALEFEIDPVVLGPQPPVAIPQAVSTVEDQPVSILLAGDSDSGAALSFMIVDEPTNGTLDISGLPTVIYTPNPGFVGTDSFSFVADDGHLVSEPATVSVTVEAAPEAPVANPQTVTTVEGESVSITLTGSDADNAPLNFSIVDMPTNGTLDTSGLPVVVYTPNPGFSGSDSFSFTVDNGEMVSDPATVTVVVEEAPVLAVETSINARPALLSVSLLGINIGQLRAQLLDADGNPVQGKELVFSIRGTERCRGTTGADGFASCRPGSGGGTLQLLLGSGYVVNFAGDDEHLPSSANGNLLTSLGLL
jgi:hypothetical protein